MSLQHRVVRSLIDLRALMLILPVCVHTAARAGDDIDLTGQWSFIAPCTACPPAGGPCQWEGGGYLIQTGSSFSGIVEMIQMLPKCQTGTPDIEGVVTGNVSGSSISFGLAFGNINFSGTIGPSGNSMGGTWAFPGGLSGTWTGSRSATDPLNIDTDGDGLLDDWEVNGIPIAGREDRIELPGANVVRKDLYVEIDAMSGLGPQSFLAFTAPGDLSTGTALDLVVGAFANSPVSNSDGSTGIRLHLLIDETNLQVEDFFLDEGWSFEFDQLKAQHYGSPAQQGDEPLLEARRKAVRYCLFASTLANDPGTRGLSEIGGDDMMVLLGAGQVTPEGQATVFMHELGHNLNLRHGGADNVNFKPNYVSVMNYAIESFASIDATYIDYSRVALPALDEAALVEGDILGPPPAIYGDRQMPHGSKSCESDPGDPRCFITLAASVLLPLGTLGEPIDWNDDGDIDTRSVCVDLNYLGDQAAITSLATPSPCQILNSHNDWAALVLPVGTSSNYDAFVHVDVSQEEMTTPLLKYLQSVIPQPPPLCAPGDLDCDGAVNGTDLGLLLLAWGTPIATTADLDGDGLVDGADLGILLLNWIS